MKKFTIFLCAILLSTIGLAQGHETFENLDLTGGSYSDGTFEGQDGSTWIYENVRGDISIEGKSATLRNNGIGLVESGTIENGIGELTFSYMQAFPNDVDLNVYINNDLVYTATTEGEQNEVKSSGIIEVNIEDDFVISFQNENGAQVAIDDVIWSKFGEEITEPEPDPDPEPDPEPAAENHETFDNFEGSGSSYADGSFIGQNGIEWEYIQSRGDAQASVFSGDNGLMLGKDRTPDAALKTEGIPNGIGTLKFSYSQPFGTPTEMEVMVNGDVVYTAISDEQNEAYTTEEIEINVEEVTELKFFNPAGAGQINLDDIIWTDYEEEGSDPDPDPEPEDIDYTNHETFDNLDLDSETSSYQDGGFTGENDVEWEYLQSRGDMDVNGRAIMLGRNRTPDAELKSTNIINGIGHVKFSVQKAFGSDIELEVQANGVTITTIEYDGDDVYTTDDIEINLAGEVELKFFNPDGGQVLIDDIYWSDYEGEEITEPTITVTPSSLNGFFQEVGTPSNEKSFVAKGELLTEDLVIEVTDGDYEISTTSGEDFSTSIALTPDEDGNVENTTIYVRLNSQQAMDPADGTITLTSEDADEKTIALEGMSEEEPEDPEPGDIDYTNHETFDNLDLDSETSSYQDGGFTGENDVEWEYLQSRGDMDVNGRAIMLGRNRTPDAELKSTNIIYGIGHVKFSVQKAFSSNIELEVQANGVTITTVEYGGEDVYTTDDIEINLAGEVELKFFNPDGGQVLIDDIYWSDYEGEEITEPTITVTPSSLNGFFQEVGTPSNEKSFVAKGELLTEDLVIEVTDGDYEISTTSGEDFSTSIALTPDEDGNVENTTIYVRLNSEEAGEDIEGTITLTSEDADEKTIALEGTSIEYIDGEIEDYREVDEDGVAVMLNEYVIATGVVHCDNYRGSGYDITIIDGNNFGLNVFSYDDINGYQATEGDEITVKGKLIQYNGLLELEATAIELISEENPTQEPTVVTELNEDTESQLVELKNLSVVNGETEWPDNDNIYVTNGTDEFLVRVPYASHMVGQAIPNAPFSLVGLGKQFDNSMPYTSGYQIFPCSATSDCDIDASITVGSFSLTANQDGATYQWIDCDTDEEIEGATAQTFEPQETGSYAVIITTDVCSETSSCELFDYTGVENDELNHINVYPNPMNEQLTIENKNGDLVSVELISVTGQVIDSVVANGNSLTINTENYTAGIYFVKVSTTTGVKTVKVVK